MTTPNNREIAAAITYGAIGYRAYENFRGEGQASQADAALQAVGSAAAWRIWIRSLLTAPLSLAILSGFTWGAIHEPGYKDHGMPWMVWFNVLFEIPFMVALLGVLYCKLVEGGLFPRRLAFRIFRPLHLAFVNVSPLWVYALMPLPYWIIIALHVVGIV